MGKMKETTIDAGEEVVHAAGELSATVAAAKEAAAQHDVDPEKVENLLTIIFKALIKALKL